MVLYTIGTLFTLLVYFVLYRLLTVLARAVGGAGLIFTEASSVTPEGRISPQDAGFWTDKHAEAWVKTIKFVHEQGAAIGVQLAHAGRKASTQRPWEGHNGVDDQNGGWTPVAPSPIAFSDTYRKPRELSVEEINFIVNAFAEAADRANRFGFDVIELHAAHGYLLHEFMSPISNKRTDNYGGSFENRIRITLETVEAMRAKWPQEKPFWIRISASDWIEGGWDIEQSIQLVKKLKELGVDVIDCSSGGIDLSQKIKVGPGYQVPFAKAIREEAKIPTCAVGLITNAEQAEQVLEHHQADYVALAREMLRDPYFPLHAAKVLGCPDAVTWPKQYERAK
jgi:2,4-dienoyl-CoA reductase-like NADH-dependent reductase (Old Yellow Enzyme family)